MPQIVPGSEPNNVGSCEASLDQVTAQLQAMASMLRQLGGDASITPGSTEPTDPLVAPFTLYVNPYIGSDRFVAGAFNDYELAAGTDEQKIAAKLKRVSNQALACGYSPNRPFKTINRAAIEAAIITSRDYYTYKGPEAQLDCVLIRVSAGRHTVYNNPGPADGATITAWADGFDPSPAELIKFNDPKGGLLLPRGASFNGDDLRKTVFAYNWAPPPADELPDFSNRAAIFRVTPLALGGQFTFMDKIGQATSVHLLDCFHNVSKAQLDRFYAKAFKAVGAGANLSAALTVTRKTEYQVVGPIQGTPAPEWDTTASASPYMFNCSIRSDWGLCGVFLDGDNTEGLDSLVTAQFTGVCLQKDMTSWEVYSGGKWITPTYAQYIAATPDDVRMKPTRVSRHLTVINDAFVQAVSVFCIGQGIGYMTANGGEATVTNSNVSFGGAAAVSFGYKRVPYKVDKSWNIADIRVPTDLSDKQGNIRRITLGSTVGSTLPGDLTITLQAPLPTSPELTNNIPLLAADGYSFVPDSYIWIQNSNGPDWRAKLAPVAFTSSAPTEIKIVGPFTNELGQTPGAAAVDPSTGISYTTAGINGKAIYIRRLADTRTPEERRWSLKLTNTEKSRIPLRDFILQTDTTQSAQVTAELPRTQPLIVSSSGRITTNTGVNLEAQVSIRNGAATYPWQANYFYRSGQIVLFGNKHFICMKEHVSTASFSVGSEWLETLVHMPSTYLHEDSYKNEGPIIVFNGDTDGSDSSTTCGYNLATAWATPLIQRQFLGASDAHGIALLLAQFGFPQAIIPEIMRPRPAAERDVDPSLPVLNSAGAVIPAPAGGAVAGWANWPVQFHRPSVIRLYGQAWEWAGYGNYSRSLPGAQGDMSEQNKFTYYFTSALGGRVYGTGFNENGYQVSPAGLIDTSTGQSISVEQIGSNDTDLNFPTSFGAITATDITASKITVTGTIEASEYRNLPSATTSAYGLVEIATPIETTTAYQSSVVPGVSDNPNAVRVVDLASLSGLRSAILSDIKLLEARYSRFYIDGNVTVTIVTDSTGISRRVVSGVTAAMWEDIHWNAKLHELDAGSTPAKPSPVAIDLANQVVFPSWDQALSFANNRDPIGATRLVFYFYGANEYKGGATDYLGRASIVWQRGPSYQPPSATAGDRSLDRRAGTIYLGNNQVQLGHDAGIPTLQLTDLVISTGTIAQPSKVDTVFGVYNGKLLNSEAFGILNVWNCEFINNTDFMRGVIALCSSTLQLFIRSLWDGPANQRTWNADITYKYKNTPPANERVFNWDAFWIGKSVQMWAQRGIGANQAGSYIFRVDLTADYTGNVSPARKIFSVFRLSKSFAYVNQLTSGEVVSTSLQMSSVDFRFNLINYQPTTFRFCDQVEVDGSVYISIFDNVLPPIQPDASWVLQDEKRTKFTITDDNKTNRNTIFFQTRACDGRDVKLTVVSGPPNSNMDDINWGCFFPTWARAVRTTYAGGAGNTTLTPAAHKVMQWGAGSVVVEQFRVVGAFVDANNLQADSEVPTFVPRLPPARLAAVAIEEAMEYGPIERF